MTGIRPEEEWVVRCLRAHLPDHAVEDHDDNSRNAVQDVSLLPRKHLPGGRPPRWARRWKGR